MKERPILFSGPMVRAILEDKKTQTRRVMKPQPCLVDTLDFSDKVWIWHPGKVWKTSSRSIWVENCPYGVGDHLWVRESIRLEPEDIFYKADQTSLDLAVLLPEQLEWLANYGSEARTNQTIPSIHMPRWASRLTLEVTGARAERLQDITSQNCVAEGFDPIQATALGITLIPAPQVANDTARLMFRSTWDKLNAKRGFGWDANPWVWVVSFKKTSP